MKDYDRFRAGYHMSQQEDIPQKTHPFPLKFYSKKLMFNLIGKTLFIGGEYSILIMLVTYL